MPKKLVIADDDPQLRKLLKSFLELNGYEVFLAEDGKACVQQVILVTPDLILIDVNMGGIDGFEVIRLAEKVRKQFKVPIFMMTAANTKENVMKAAALQIEDFITKPINLVDLKQRIDSQLFKMDYELLKTILPNLGSVGSEPLSQPRIRKYFDQKYKAFSAIHGDFKLCVLIFPPVTDVKTWTEKDCLAKVVVFAKMAKGWKRVWPDDLLETADINYGT